MAEKTEIAWCDSTFNGWIGCTKIGPGCDNCYAEADFDLRKHRAKWGAGQPRSRTTEDNWRNPLKWERQHAEFFAEHGRRRRVFCASLGDVFDNDVPADWRRDLFALIDKTPNLDWLLLTKRIGNAERMMRESCGFLEPSPGCYTPRPNVWLGATICNQEEADRDIPKLLAVPAAVRWISAEPLLGPVDLDSDKADGLHALGCGRRDCECGNRGLDWIVVGGESSQKARPMHPAWARSLRDQCAASGAAFHFKQWGEWAPERGDSASAAHRWPIEHGEPDGGVWSYRVGKKSAGRLLDGVLHDEYPEVIK